MGDSGAADRVTCPVRERPGRALTSTGKLKQHDDPVGTARARNRGGPFARELCRASGLTMEEATAQRDGGV